MVDWDVFGDEEEELVAAAVAVVEALTIVFVIGRLLLLVACIDCILCMTGVGFVVRDDDDNETPLKGSAVVVVMRGGCVW